MTFPVLHPHKITQGFKESHKGIDIAPIPAGTQGVEVVSPEGAVVIASGSRPSLEGQYLKLQGDSGMYYYFGHFASRLVSVGQRVPERQVIGIMGMTGLADGIHTHHEVRTTSNDGQVDPIKYYKEVSVNPTANQVKDFFSAYLGRQDLTPKEIEYYTLRDWTVMSIDIMETLLRDKNNNMSALVKANNLITELKKNSCTTDERTYLDLLKKVVSK